MTITGADESVDPGYLLEMSRSFPFVEWAILCSATRRGIPRYPSYGWIRKLGMVLRRAADGKKVRIALHLCGTLAANVFEGKYMPNDIPITAKRVQWNGWRPSPRMVPPPAAQRRLAALYREVILQARGEEVLGDAQAAAAKIEGAGEIGASVLFDPSGGMGKSPGRWPHPPACVTVGYAGGIGPDNVGGVLGDLAVAGARMDDGPPWWIDMESGVRDSHDQFDRRKVRQVLESCSAFVARTA